MDKSRISPLRIVIKALILFLTINFAFIPLMDVPVGKPSLYNLIFPGRGRFPFGENPSESYSLSLYNLDAMLASHEISSRYNPEDYNVFLLGDSSVWGYLQKPEETLAGLLESDSTDISIYNFGYPSLSVLKDLMVFEEIKEDYQPDLVIWMVTLESLPLSLQMETPLVENNPLKANAVIAEYELSYLKPLPINFQNFTLINRRRELADILRLQLYGVMWSATGIDQEYAEQYNPATRDFEADDLDFYDFEIGILDEDNLALDVIANAVEQNPETQFIIINEPILISRGENSDIRYNFYYPRWAYDQYREIIQASIDQYGIEYYDYWDVVPEENFTNSAIHLDLEGETILADRIFVIINEFKEDR